MDKQGVAHSLEEIAAFLELKAEDPFRIRAYRTAARVVATLPGNLDEAVASGRFAVVKGIGPAMLEIVSELLRRGRCRMLDGLRDEVPPGLVDMLRISGLGVAKVRQIHDSLGIETLADLEAAAGDGRLAQLPRFGRKTADNVLKGIASLREARKARSGPPAVRSVSDPSRAGGDRRDA